MISQKELIYSRAYVIDMNPPGTVLSPTCGMPHSVFNRVMRLGNLQVHTVWAIYTLARLLHHHHHLLANHALMAKPPGLKEPARPTNVMVRCQHFHFQQACLLLIRNWELQPAAADMSVHEAVRCRPMCCSCLRNQSCSC